MSEAINNGGPAFPVSEEALMRNLQGMTLRDYFAAQALPAVYRDLWDDVRAGRHGSVPEEWRMGVALDAYALADAMLKVRETT